MLGDLVYSPTGNGNALMAGQAAGREVERIRAYLEAQGTPMKVANVQTGSGLWNAYRSQFMALYTALGSYEDAKALAPDFIQMPRRDNGTPEVLINEVYIRSWVKRLDEGLEECDPKLLKIMERKIERKFNADARTTIRMAGKALQHLAQKVLDDTLDPRTQSQILSLGQAHNYGLGNYAQLHKALAVQAPGATLSFNGRLMLDAGPKPREQPGKRMRKHVKVLNVTPTEVSDGDD